MSDTAQLSDTARREARPADPSAPAAKLGAELRERRHSLGWELPDLAGSLRIRQSYLEAIEAGRIGDLPGTTYALGFVRAYASAMGLAGEQMVGRFRAEAAEASVRPALSFPAPVPQRGVPAGALMLLGLVILAAAYSGWYYVSEHQRTPPETVPPIPDHLLPHTAAKPTPSPQVASILPTASAPAPVPTVTSPTPSPSAALTQAAGQTPPATPPRGAAPTIATAPPPPAPARTGPATTGPVTTGPATTGPVTTGPATTGPVTTGPVTTGPATKAPATPAPVTAPAAAPGQPTLPAGTRIVVKANADAWVTVKPKSGPPAFNRLMHAGDTWPVPPGAAGLSLTTGNAGGTELDVDNTPVVSLGASGAVRRDLPLDADLLKSGHLPPSGHAKAKPAPSDPAAD